MAANGNRRAADQVVVPEGQARRTSASHTPAGKALSRRQLAEARQRRRGIAIAGVSTAIAIAAVIILVPMAPGWEKVRLAFFNGEVLVETFPRLLEAFLVDLAVFAWCAPIIAVWGLVIALCRDARAPALYPLRLFAIIYNDLFRGVPIILVVYLFGFGIPGLGLARPWNSPYIWGSLALILSYSAYVAEVYRSGIESVHESQRAAARSLGLSEADVMRYVVLPQAIRRVIPASMNNLVSLQKDVALLSFVGPVEVLRQAGIEKSLLANFTPFVGAAILFLAITVPATRAVDRMMAREKKRQS